MFNRRAQESGETIDHYMTDVIKLAENCQYGELRDDLIRDRLVSGIRDDKVREKLFEAKQDHRDPENKSSSEIPSERHGKRGIRRTCH